MMTRKAMNAAAAELGRRGGLKGGKRSLQTMTAEQRRARASKAGKASAQAKRKRGRVA